MDDPVEQVAAFGCVAEGIETARQRDALLALGASAGRGFLYSRPVAESELTALLDAQRALAIPPAPADLAGFARKERNVTPLTHPTSPPLP